MELQFTFPMSQLALWLGLGVLLLAIITMGLRFLEKQRARRLDRFVQADLAPRLLSGYDAKVRRPLFWLVLMGCVMLALTMAQPKWGKSWIEVERGSRDILILLDTSESMNAQNPLPNRLERARQKIESMLEKCPGDRFGLIAFSGEAALQCPLTLDHGYFRTVLSAINTNTLSEEGTDIAEALREASNVYAEDIAATGEESRHTRAIVLISDGEQVSGDAVKTAKEIEPYAGIYVLGIGDPKGAEVTYPQWMTQYKRVPDANKPHLSKLDEKTLSKIAVEGGGVYVRTTPDNADVNHIRKELEAMQSRSVSGDLRFSLVNRYRWPLSIAILCFTAEGLWTVLMPRLRLRRMRREEGHGYV
jgi:Ca-activated chloride channel family protein